MSLERATASMLLLAGVVALVAACDSGDGGGGSLDAGLEGSAPVDAAGGPDASPPDATADVVVDAAADATVTMPCAGPHGVLDTTFGTGGIVYDSNRNAGHAVAFQPDGKIVVAGIASSRAMVLLRFDAAGTLDPSFGTSGVSKIPVPVDLNDIQTVRVLADGKILTLTNGDFQLLRFDTTGALDTTFGVGGIAEVGFVAPGDDTTQSHSTDFLVEPSGNIVVLGGVSPDAQTYRADFGLVRTLANGALDTTFGIDGKVRRTITGSSPGVRDGRLQRVAGGAFVASWKVAGQPSLIKYTSGGVLDGAFGTSGIASTSTIAGVAPSVTAAPDGSLFLAAGDARDLMVVHASSTGVFDPTFGTNGSASIDFNARLERMVASAPHPDGGVLLAGLSASGGTATYQVVLARVLSNGTFDPAFGAQGGTLTPGETGSFLEPNALAVQGCSAVVVANSDNRFALLRYRL